MKQKHLLMALFGFLSFIVSSCGESTVSPSGESTVSPSGVTLNKTVLTLKKGMNEKLIATVAPENVSNSKVIWTSSDNSVVSILDGVCTAVNGGTATVTVTTEDGKFSASCAITVTISVTSITFSNDEIRIERGNQTNLVVKVLPEDATNKSLTWKTSDESIATVDESGKITAINKGIAKITVTNEDGTVVGSCNVAVFVNVTGISLSKKDLTITEGKKNVITATILPSDASNTDITWNSNNESVASVSSTGEITAIKPGQATITATSGDKIHFAACLITVTSSKNVSYHPYGDNKNW